MDYITLPDWKIIANLVCEIPEYMVPTVQPYAVVLRDALSIPECNEINNEIMKIEGYRFPHCDATTREIPRPLPKYLGKVHYHVRMVNDAIFKFDLNDGAAAWHQTYTLDDGYPLHRDSAVGMSRKLTAIVMLSNSISYYGGDLNLIPYPENYIVPNHQGNIVVFPSWIPHKVTPVKQGTRQTINMGFYGPPFK